MPSLLILQSLDIKLTSKRSYVSQYQPKRKPNKFNINDHCKDGNDCSLLKSCC